MLSRLYKRSSLLTIGVAVAAIMVTTAVMFAQERVKLAKNSRRSKLDTEGKIATKPASMGKRPFGVVVLPSHGANMGLASEITLDEALRDSKIKVLVPTYLPPNAKLDTVRRWVGGYYMITQYYDLGEEWIEIEAIAKPDRPDYEKDVLARTTAERVRPDGSKETVVINSSAVVGEPQPDGSIEPRGIDRNWLVTVKGITGEFTEVSGIATVRMGRNPQRVSPRNFASVRIWRNGTEYVVGGSNISRDQVLKIAESMF